MNVTTCTETCGSCELTRSWDCSGSLVVCVWVCVCVTHGVSSMTLQTLAMVLRQSVVFSSGRVLFYSRQISHLSRFLTHHRKQHDVSSFSEDTLTSVTKFVVAVLSVFSMGVASA